MALQNKFGFKRSQDRRFFHSTTLSEGKIRIHRQHESLQQTQVHINRDKKGRSKRDYHFMIKQLQGLFHKKELANSMRRRLASSSVLTCVGMQVVVDILGTAAAVQRVFHDHSLKCGGRGGGRCTISQMLNATTPFDPVAQQEPTCGGALWLRDEGPYGYNSLTLRTSKWMHGDDVQTIGFLIDPDTCSLTQGCPCNVNDSLVFFAGSRYKVEDSFFYPRLAPGGIGWPWRMHWNLCPAWRERKTKAFYLGIFHYVPRDAYIVPRNPNLDFEFCASSCPDVDLKPDATFTSSITGDERFHRIQNQPGKNLMIHLVPIKCFHSLDIGLMDLTLSFGPCLDVTQVPKFTRYNIDNATSPLVMDHTCLPAKDEEPLYIGVRPAIVGGPGIQYNLTVSWMDPTESAGTRQFRSGHGDLCYYTCREVMREEREYYINRNNGCTWISRSAPPPASTHAAVQVLAMTVAMFWFYS